MTDLRVIEMRDGVGNDKDTLALTPSCMAYVVQRSVQISSLIERRRGEAFDGGH